MNSFTFASLENSFSPSIIKGSFARCSTLGWQFLLLALNISCNSLLAWKISAEKYDDSFMRGSFACNRLPFFCFKLLPLSLTFDILIITWFGMDTLGWSYFEFSGLPGSGCLFLSPCYRHIQPLFLWISFIPFSLSPLLLGSSRNCILVHLVVSHKFLMLYWFLFLFAPLIG